MLVSDLKRKSENFLLSSEQKGGKELMQRCKFTVDCWTPSIKYISLHYRNTWVVFTEKSCAYSASNLPPLKIKYTPHSPDWNLTKEHEIWLRRIEWEAGEGKIRLRHKIVTHNWHKFFLRVTYKDILEEGNLNSAVSRLRNEAI